jgi:beta-hydroxylase
MYFRRDSEAVLFDEPSFTGRKTRRRRRVILFCDVERPLHTGVARAANRFVGRTFVAAAATANEPGEKVGVLNRIFGFFHRMRAHTTRLKKWNRFVYYSLKILVLGGLFYLVFLA